MVVGVMRIDLLLPGPQSLKEKRAVLKKVIERTRNTFRVAIAETGSHDLWQRAEVGVSIVGTDRSFINEVLDKVIDFIETIHTVEISDYTMEFM